MKQDTPWDYSAEGDRNGESDYHSFMIHALRKHPQKNQIGLVYGQHYIRHHPWITPSKSSVLERVK
jgi:hypothetical protein